MFGGLSFAQYWYVVSLDYSQIPIASINIGIIKPIVAIPKAYSVNVAVVADTTLMDDTVVLMDDPTAQANPIRVSLMNPTASVILDKPSGK